MVKIPINRKYLQVKINQFAIFFVLGIAGCQPGSAPSHSLHAIISSLGRSVSNDGAEKAWSDFNKKYSVPFPYGDSVVFFYYGDAQSVQWVGDFNGWSQGDPKVIGQEIEGSSIWYARLYLPADARMDYKIVVDGNWILDPENENKQMAGVGGGIYNSELRMPDWRPDTTGKERPQISKGTLSESNLLVSSAMGYGINYKVYTPAGYDSLEDLPTLYVTDGQEYVHPEMGNMINILDNLIYDKRIKPLIVVLIDPRNPDNVNENRRMTELVINPSYVKFVTEDLIPQIEVKYKVSKEADYRGILGTSLGGLNSAYFNAMAPGVFHLIGINSPAFQYKPEIYSIYDTLQTVPAKIIMTTGVIHDTEEGARKMKGIMEGKNYPLKYIEINQGHSWGNWESLLDDVLIYLYGD